jgi:uncharacterized protein (UPF0548 family)
LTVKLGDHTVKAGDRVRTRRMPRDEWIVGRVLKVEHGIVTVRFGNRVVEWVESEMPWRYERGCLEFQRPRASA